MESDGLIWLPVSRVAHGERIIYGEVDNTRRCRPGLSPVTDSNGRLATSNTHTRVVEAGTAIRWLGMKREIWRMCTGRVVSLDLVLLFVRMGLFGVKWTIPRKIGLLEFSGIYLAQMRAHKRNVGLRLEQDMFMYMSNIVIFWEGFVR